MKFKHAINEVSAPEEYEIPEYDQGALIDALMSEKPDIELKTVFGEAFYPKVMRWLDLRLKKIKVPDEAKNYVGGSLKYKLDQYLEKDNEEDAYEENAETLSREILNAINEWDKKVIKDMNLPAPKL
jgi:hypothetical protein